MLVKAAECGIAPGEFWKMTWKDFQIVLQAHERNEVNGWRRFRLLAWMTYAANTTDKVKKSMESFMPLPGDRVVKRTPPDAATMLKAFEKMGIRGKS